MKNLTKFKMCKNKCVCIIKKKKKKNTRREGGPIEIVVGKRNGEREGLMAGKEGRRGVGWILKNLRWFYAFY